MLDQKQHDALVDRLYASALGDQPWSATLDKIAGSFRASKALVQVLNTGRQLVSFDMHGYSLDFAAEFYAGELYNSDPRVAYFRAAKPGTVYFDRSMFDVEAMDRDPRCRACSDALGVQYSLGAAAGLPDKCAGNLVLMTAASEGQSSDAAIKAFRRLSPHIAQAFSIGQVLEQRTQTQTALLEALARKADGIIVLTDAGLPIFMNDVATAALAADDGLAFSDGEFWTKRAPETRRLRSLIDAATAKPVWGDARMGGYMMVTRPSGLRPYILNVMAAPRNERFLAGGIGCVIHLNDFAAVRLPSKSMMMATFGLTERECDLVIALIRCAGLSEAAANAQMAVNTARNHLQGIFRKSGTRAQAELVQLFTRLA